MSSLTSTSIPKATQRGTDIDDPTFFFSLAQSTSLYSASSLSVKIVDQVQDLSLYVWQT